MRAWRSRAAPCDATITLFSSIHYTNATAFPLRHAWRQFDLPPSSVAHQRCLCRMTVTTLVCASEGLSSTEGLFDFTRGHRKHEAAWFCVPVY